MSSKTVENSVDGPGPGEELRMAHVHLREPTLQDVSELDTCYLV
jgi:hypothetical protein